MRTFVIGLSTLLFWHVTHADMAVVPVPPVPTHSPAVPATALLTSGCVGVSDAGVVACNAMWRWRGAGRFGVNYQIELAYTYDIVTKTLSVLPALAGDKYTRAFVTTPAGRVCGQSTNGRSTYSVTTWQAGAVASYGYGTLTDCDDLGRIALGARIYTGGAWVTIPNALAVLALSNNGDFVAAYTVPDAGGVEHVALYRASEHPEVAEDACAYPCLAQLTKFPTKVVINASGVVTWHTLYTPYPALGFRAVPHNPNVLGLSGMVWAAINTLGDVAGADKILHLNNTISTIPPSGGFTTVNALGINAYGAIVGDGKYGSSQRGFVLTP